MMRSLVVIAVAIATLAARPARADDRARDESATLYTCKPSAVDAKLTAQFNPEISIRELSTWLVGFTCKTMVFGDGVATSPARVTIIAPSKMTSKQAVHLYVDAAGAARFLVVQNQ